MQMNRRLGRKTWLQAAVFFILFLATTPIFLFQNCSGAHFKAVLSDDSASLASTACNNTEYVNSSGQCVPMICEPSTSTAVSCDQIPNGAAEKTCDLIGSGYNACEIKCNNRFALSGVAPHQVCQALLCANNATNSPSCDICPVGYFKVVATNGSINCQQQVCDPNPLSSSYQKSCGVIANGLNIKTCNTVGSAYGSCQVSCNQNSTSIGGACVVMICAPNTQRSCQSGNNIGSQTCNSTGTAWSECGNLSALTSPIVTRTINGQGTFYNSATATTFSPRGVNYIRLNSEMWHNVFEPGGYSHTLSERELSSIASSGYNYVRIFLDGKFLGEGSGGLTNPGLSSVWLSNVADFLALAGKYNLYVTVTGPWVPSNYVSIVSSASAPSSLTGINAVLLNEGYAKAQAQFLTDFLTGLKSTNPATLKTIMAIDILNEECLSVSQWPFNLKSGPLLLNGITYDMGNATARQQLVDANSVRWANTITKAVRDVAPGILVSASLFTPLAVGGDGFNGVQCFSTPCSDDRYPLRPSVLMQNSSLDYIDIHVYPSGPSYSLAADLGSAEITAGTVWSKPLLMGEYGVVKNNYYNTAALAAATLTSQLQLSCQFGFTGWGLWTWDTTEQIPQFWIAAESNGAINDIINNVTAPKSTPNICAATPAGLFTVGGSVAYSNGHNYCVYSDWNSFTTLTGRTNTQGIPSYPRFSALMPFDGSCK